MGPVPFSKTRYVLGWGESAIKGLHRGEELPEKGNAHGNTGKRALGAEAAGELFPHGGRAGRADRTKWEA